MQPEDPNLQTPQERETDQPAEELDELQTKVRSFPEEQWTLYQRLGGGVLGIVCGLLLTLVGSYESVGMYGTIGALLVALIVPNMIEKRVKRSIRKGRIALIITFAAWLVAYAAFMLISGVPIIANPA